VIPVSIRIVSDSSSDVFDIPGVDYVTVPLKIMFGGREYVDEPGLDTEEMMDNLLTEKGPSTTSCPNVHDWLAVFEGSDEIFAITISSGLSASYESCSVAKDEYKRSHPGAQVHIFDSKATGPVLHLIIRKLAEGIRAGKTYAEVKAETIEYQKRIRILYALESLNNLARNGRVSATVAALAGVLNIRVIGHANSEGKVDILHKTRGERRTLMTMVREMEERGFDGGLAIIDHCLNEDGAKKLGELIVEKFPAAEIVLESCGALCSYYADRGGLILGYAVK